MAFSSLFDRRTSTLLLPLLAVGLALAGCGGNGNSDSDADGVPYNIGDVVSDSTVALIVSSEYGTDTLLASRYRQQMQMAMQRRSPSQRSPEQMQKMHQNMIRGYARQHVLRGEAKERGLEVDTARVSSQLNQLMDRYESEEAFRKQLARNNLTVDSIRSLLADQLRRQALQQQFQENYEQPTENEVQSYSKENRRIRAQHILIRVSENDPQAKVDSARQAAQVLVDSAQMSSVDFADLARRHSEGPSAERGGDLGFFNRGQMVEEFADAAYALSDSGDVAPEPVRTRFGFHVIRLTDAGQPMDTTKARQQMAQERRKQAVEDEVDALLENVTVHINPDVASAGLVES